MWLIWSRRKLLILPYCPNTTKMLVSIQREILFGGQPRSFGMAFKITEFSLKEVSFLSKQNVLTCSSFLPAAMLGLIWLECDCHSSKIIPVNWEPKQKSAPSHSQGTTYAGSRVYAHWEVALRALEVRLCRVEKIMFPDLMALLGK